MDFAPARFEHDATKHAKRGPKSGWRRRTPSGAATVR